MQKVMVVSMAKLVRTHLTSRSESAPHGVIQMDASEVIEVSRKDGNGKDVTEHFVGSAGDLYCTDESLCARALQLLDDLAQWAANDRAVPVRMAGARDLVQPALAAPLPAAGGVEAQASGE